MRRAVDEKVNPIRSSAGSPQTAATSRGLSKAKPSAARSVTTSVRLIRYITGPSVVVVKKVRRKSRTARPQRGRISGDGSAVSPAGGTSSRRGRKGGRGGSGGVSASEIFQVLPGFETDGLA